MHPDDPALRSALKLHLALLTPRQRTSLRSEEGQPSNEARAALRAVGDREIDKELECCRRLGIRVATDEDPRWPPLLREIADPPAALWIRGELPCPSKLPLAIVGSRRPTAYGLSMAARLAAQVAELGAVVVSGGALGVDGAAHGAALTKGSTVAVLGCGVNVAYPQRHRQLYEEIARGGAVVSELPCGTPPRKHHFPIRNRLLAGWARAVLVVEATLQSGSLITARLALEMGRDVLALPGPVTSSLSEGTNQLIVEGAPLLRSAADVLNQLRDEELANLVLPVPQSGEPGARAAQGDEDPVLAALPSGLARGVEELVLATRLPTGQVLSRLVSHEAKGLVLALEGGRWMRSESIQ